MTGLPTPNQAWPPPPHDLVLAACQERQVWWEGDSQKLAKFYGTGSNPSPSGNLRTRINRAVRAFWSQPEPTLSQPKRLHVPVAADIGRVAAATLFSEPVSFTDARDNAQAQKRIDTVLNTEDTYSRLLVAAESASMLSGVYGRTVWDSEVADNAFIHFVDADRAIPTFKWGKLTEVSFWTELDSDNENIVYRHIEHYSKGKIDHALYVGTPSNLGRVTALTDHPATAVLATSDLTDGTTILTGSDNLAAAYFPNHRPNPQWRNVPELSALGRADLTVDVIELLDAMDRTWSSWMNDLEIGRGRIVVSENLTTSGGGPGKGTTFRLDQSVYSTIGNGQKDGEETSVLEAHQFAIRVDEHAATFDALLRRTISRAGYSPLTFGLSDEVAATATEVDAKERDTNSTRSARIRLWSGLADLATTTLEIDAVQFPGKGITPEEPLNVEWPATHQESQTQLATTVEMMNRAIAVSIETKVKTLHPDWDQKQIDAEVAAIKDETSVSTATFPTESDGAPTPDPTLPDGTTPPEENPFGAPDAEPVDQPAQ